MVFHLSRENKIFRFQASTPLFPMAMASMISMTHSPMIPLNSLLLDSDAVAIIAGFTQPAWFLSAVSIGDPARRRMPAGKSFSGTPGAGPGCTGPGSQMPSRRSAAPGGAPGISLENRKT